MWLQSGIFRKNELIIKHKEKDIQRGSIGLGVTKVSHIYFDGVQVTPYDPKNGIYDPKDDKRNFDKCLVKNDIVHRRKYCESIYGREDRVNKNVLLLEWLIKLIILPFRPLWKIAEKSIFTAKFAVILLLVNWKTY